MARRRRRGQNPKPKKENGQWKIRYWIDQAQADGTVRRVKKTKCLGKVGEMTLSQACREARQFLQPINDLEGGIEYSEMTVNQLIAKWRTAIKPNLKRSTQESYEWAFKRIERVFGRVPVAQMEKADVQVFLTEAGQDLAPESLYDLRARLSGLVSTAEEWGWIRSGANPVKGKLVLPERAPVRQKVILWPAVFRQLVMALPQPYSTVLMLAVLSGLRKGELEALRRRDLRPRKVTVDAAVYRGHLDSPKTPKSRRSVSIGPTTRKALEEWCSVAKFKGADDFLFAIRTNTPIDLHNAVARHIKPMCRKLGIPEVSWHDLRHTYTTWGRRAGVKAEAMRDQLGHSSVLMTLDVYSHTEDRESEAALIERYAWPEDDRKVA